jgi:TolB-like protein/DNA-binding winged helix-turn-helix (wHTH) protein/Tfp pilus assembly protein PilF
MLGADRGGFARILGCAPGLPAQASMQQSAPASLAFDDVLIDFAGRRLVRGGVGQPLEPKAFDVLALLAGTPGQVFTRDGILDAVWGHRHVTPGVLNRIMTLLRQALGEDAHHPRLLHTLHGVGYRFDLPGPAAEAAAEAAQASMPATPPPATPPAAAPSPVRHAGDRSRAFSRLALWSLPLLVLLAFASWRLWPDTMPPAAAGAAALPAMERSIAVLPLVNASNDAEQQFFSDGLSENLIDTLSRFEGLKVIGRTSAFQFRDGKADSATIGRKLGVAYLLGGSVQRAGDVVRINASLTKAADGSTLWAEHYDRPYKDLFALQDEITAAVADALQVKLLSPGETARHDDRPPSGNIDAYDAYLQGLKHWHDEDFPRAAEYMARAVQLDPGYAMAWAHLSGSWSTVATFSNEAPAAAREHMRIARHAADKALQLAPGLGPAHAARAYLLFYDFDYRGALAGCRRAVQLAPDDGTVLNGCGYTLAGIGRLDEAIALRERLLSIEPLYTVNYHRYAELLMATGRLDAAEKYLRIAESLSQSKSSPLIQSMYVAIARGDAATALGVARHRPAPWREMDLAIATQMSPDRAAADAALAKVLADRTWAKTSPYLVAQAYALRGDFDGTVDWLERAPTGDLLFMLSDPIILRARDDPRLVAFCKKVGLPPPATSEALSLDQIRAANRAHGR